MKGRRRERERRERKRRMEVRRVLGFEFRVLIGRSGVRASRPTVAGTTSASSVLSGLNPTRTSLLYCQ